MLLFRCCFRSLEERYDHQGSNYEYSRSNYNERHYGRDSAYHEADENLPASYRDRSRDRAYNRGGSYYTHSSSSNRTEGQTYDQEQDPHYRESFAMAGRTDSDTFSDSSLRKNPQRHKRGRSSRKSSHSPKSGSVTRSRSYSHSASRSRSRSRSSDSRSSVSGSENWESNTRRSRSKESDRESRNTENTQSSSGATKHAGLCIKNLASRSTGMSKSQFYSEIKICVCRLLFLWLAHSRQRW